MTGKHCRIAIAGNSPLAVNLTTSPQLSSQKRLIFIFRRCNVTSAMGLTDRHNSTHFSLPQSLPRKAVLLFGMTLLISGCVSPRFTRFPTTWVNHPTAESRAYQQQDPFPDPDIGPEVQARPPGFYRPRTESRRAAEQRLLFGAPNSPELVPRGYPRGGLSRPAAVY